LAKTTYRLTPVRRLVNIVAKTLLQLGIPLGTSSLITVRGRKSGKMHTIVVTLVEQDWQRWLVAPYGDVNWVRNIRSVKQAILTRRRRSQPVRLRELSSAEAAPVLKQYLTQVHVVQPYFDVTPESSLQAFKAEAARHPVFRIEEAA
jgi:deazaflavin-dependent oxidoreductase (nitroreductase family)